MLVRPLCTLFTQNTFKPLFKGKEETFIGEGAVEYSNDVFLNREKSSQHLEFLDYLLKSESDITALEHGTETGKILTKSEQILKGTLKKIKK